MLISIKAPDQGTDGELAWHDALLKHDHQTWGMVSLPTKLEP